MLPRFSVKKSITIYVAMVIIIVLGIVSYTKMTPDLLPNMDLPYIMIMTTYPGATPEEVETTVTKPMEQSMATLENISAVTSTSSENYSMVMLEFTEDANLDIVAVDILQQISLLEGAWDDMVGTPYLLKLNPSMLPVRTTAVDMEGMDVAELSAFVDEVLMNKLEGTDGVASISASGMLEQVMHVDLNPDKISELNDKIAELIDERFAEAEKELNDALAEVENGLAELEKGKTELEDGKVKLAEELAKATAEMDAGQMELLSTKIDLTQAKAQLSQALEQALTGEKTLLEIQKSLQQLEARKAELKPQVEGLTALVEKMRLLNEQENTFKTAIEEIENNDLLTDEQKATLIDRIRESDEYKQLQEEQAKLDAQLTEMGVTREELPRVYTEVLAEYAAIETGLAQLDSTLEMMGYSRSDIDKTLEELSSGKNQINSGMSQIDQAMGGLNDGTIQIKDARATLEQKKIEGIFQMSDAAVQLILTEKQLNSALEEINKGLEQIEQTKSDTLKSADLNNTITMDMLAQILTAQNFSMPAGYVKDEAGVSYVVSVGDTLNSREELEEMLLFDMDMEGLDPIYLTDVADVYMTDNSDEIYAKVNGNNSVMLSFSKQSTYATATVSDNITAKFAQLEAEYPGLHFTDMSDQGDYIYIIINSITDSLLWGAVFAVIILFVFLKDIRPTFITLCSIPISLLFALALMYFSGVTLNMISLSGLAVAVGMLVDNAVVVIENTYRLRNKGESAVKAAVSGAAQVSGAIAASTLTTVCVFLPIVFVEGMTKQLFLDMALTIGYALLASLVIALTLVPAMAKSMLKNTKPKKSTVMDWLMGGYRKVLIFCLNHKAIVLLLALAVLVGSALAVVNKGFTYMPDMEMDQLSGSIIMPEGSTLSDTAAMADKVAARIQGIPGVGTVGTQVSGGSSLSNLTGGTDATTVSLYVLYDESSDRSGDEIMADLEGMFDDLDCTVTLSSTSSMNLSALGGSGVSINLYGEDMELLQETAKELAALMGSVPGTTEVSDGMEDADPSIRIVVDKEKAMKKGLTVAQVYMEIAGALTNETSSTAVNWEGYQYDIMVGNGENGKTPEDIRNYKFTVTKRDGTEEEIALADIAEIKDTESLSTISRQNQRRYLTISAGIADGYNVTNVTAEVQNALESYDLPAGMSIEYTGENETIMEAFEQLGLMLLLGVLLVYLIMAAQFQSLKSPFIVMFTIPLAFTGGFLALLITGMELSVISLIGFVMLCGIIVNNGIVLVDYINQVRLEGMEKREAVVDAGVTRIRPILMTSITTILGLIVMAMGVGTGSEMMQPIAVVSIGGLTYATLMTLFVVPVLYEMMNRKDMIKIDESELEISLL